MKAGKKLNIAFFGSSLVSAYWNGAATYYRGIISALHGRGHNITFYEPDAYGRQEHRDIADPDWASVIVYSGQDGVSMALEDAKKADLIIKASGVGVFDEFLEREVPRAKRRDSVCAFWDVDAPATLERLDGNPGDPFIGLIPEYDLIFTYGGGAPVKEAYGRLGAKNCFPIYNALDPETHYPVPPDARFKCDLAFLGNRLPDREQRVEEFFLKPALAMRGAWFLLGGNGWKDRQDGQKLPPNVTCLGHVYTADHNAFNSTPLAVLNINRESMARYGFSPPTRIFEAAGAGACIITDEWKGIELFLEPGKEILTARDGAEVLGHLGSLTAFLARARKTGEAARRRVLNEHTYAHRAIQFDLILEGAKPFFRP
jgi:spore maturation protein CgeB